MQVRDVCGGRDRGVISSLVFRDVENNITGTWICLGTKSKQRDGLESTDRLILGMTTHRINPRTSLTSHLHRSNATLHQKNSMIESLEKCRGPCNLQNSVQNGNSKTQDQRRSIFRVDRSGR